MRPTRRPEHEAPRTQQSDRGRDRPVNGNGAASATAGPTVARRLVGSGQTRENAGDLVDLARRDAVSQQRSRIGQSADRSGAPLRPPHACSTGALVDDHCQRIAVVLRLTFCLAPECEQVTHALHDAADPEPHGQSRARVIGERSAGRGHRILEGSAQRIGAGERFGQRHEGKHVVAARVDERAAMYLLNYPARLAGEARERI